MLDKETRKAAIKELNEGADAADVRKKYGLAHQTIPTWVRHGYIKPLGARAAAAGRAARAASQNSNHRTLVQRIEELEAQVAELSKTVEILATPDTGESERRLLLLERELGIAAPDSTEE